MKNKRVFALLLTLTFLTTLSLAYSLDINGLKTEPYSIGDEITFTPILLDGEEEIQDEISLEIYDLKESKLVEDTATSNQEKTIKLEEDYPHGLWTVKATYKEETVERIFSIREKASVDFSIEGDTLLIKNTGNIRYQKTIQITIGTTKQSKTLNIPVAEQKEWKLVAPEGVYDIHITDGENSISKKNIKLVGGTGNVIGAIDEGLVGYSGFGTTPTEDLEDKFISLNKLPIAIIFIIIIFALGILVAVERLTKRN